MTDDRSKDSAERMHSIYELQQALDRSTSQHLAMARQYHEQFRHNTPFPHVVVDDFLPADLARDLFEAFPGTDSPIWTKQPTDDQRGKFATTDDAQIPPLQRFVLFHLNSGASLRLLERITGIEGLIADTKLVGGGLHQIERGGKLAVHVDYSHHPQNRLFRRLNLLLYLNRNWHDEYGGDLELWDAQVSRCQKRIAPLFNRVVIFATSEASYHGHPEPLTVPPGLSRKSLSLYYFTKDPPEGKESVEHNTSFKSRPGDPFNLSSFVLRSASSGLFRDLMPPLLYKGIRQVWNRRFTGR